MRLSIRLLSVSLVFLLLGRGYGYLFWGSPLRVLLANEALLTPLLNRLFGTAWADYANDLTVAAWTEIAQRCIGVVWVITGLLCARAGFRLPGRAWRRLLRFGVAVSWLFLLLHALLETEDHFLRPVHFCEFAIQLAVPFLYLSWLRGRLTRRNFCRVGRLAVALTFAAHGLYALGAYPVPGHFVDMTIILLGTKEATARTFLTVVGWLDLVVAVGIFFRPVAGPLLLYATAWGLATALARLATGYQLGVPDVWHQYAYLTTYRLPHGLLPLALYFWRCIRFKDG